MTAVHVELGCAAVLFGLDGVLVESRRATVRPWRRWAERHGVPEGALFAAHLDTVGTDLLERAGALDTDELTRCPGAARMIAALPPGRLAVVTPGSRPLATAWLREVRLPVPTVMVTGSAPAPEGYLQAAERIGVPANQCVVITDAYPSVLAARAAGCRVVGIAGTPLGSESEPDLVVASLADLRVESDGNTITLHFEGRTERRTW